MRKRTNNDIWKGLYEFYLLENKKLSDDKVNSDILKTLVYSHDICKLEPEIYNLKLTHQHITVRFTHYYLKSKSHVGNSLSDQGFRFYNVPHAKLLPKPVIIDKYLKKRVF
jgi:A/G-specific adenine glycosylase